MRTRIGRTATSREQWLSHLEQINAVSRLRPTSILEVGCGNGLVSWALKKRGFPVQTVDINPSLEPDFVGNVVDLPQVVGGRTYDLVLCAEVLEHLPFDLFPSALHALAACTQRYAVLTLPDNACVVTLDVKFTRLPRITLLLPRFRVAALPPVHAWAISQSGTPLRKIVSELRRCFHIDAAYRLRDNPAHRFFILVKRSE